MDRADIECVVGSRPHTILDDPYGFSVIVMLGESGCVEWRVSIRIEDAIPATRATYQRSGPTWLWNGVPDAFVPEAIKLRGTALSASLAEAAAANPGRRDAGTSPRLTGFGIPGACPGRSFVTMRDRRIAMDRVTFRRALRNLLGDEPCNYIGVHDRTSLTVEAGEVEGVRWRIEFDLVHSFEPLTLPRPLYLRGDENGETAPPRRGDQVPPSVAAKGEAILAKLRLGSVLTDRDGAKPLATLLDDLVKAHDLHDASAVGTRIEAVRALLGTAHAR